MSDKILNEHEIHMALKNSLKNIDVKDLGYFDDIKYIEPKINYKKKYFNIKEFKSAACMVIIFALLSGAFGVYLSKQTVSAFKVNEEKKLYKIMEGFFSTEKPTEAVGDGKTEIQREESIETKYTNMNQIEHAIKFLPELCVPTYIPKGYGLESLNIRKSAVESFSVVYVFKNKKGDTISINMSNDENNQSTVGIEDNHEEEFNINVSGTVSEEELKEISEGLVQGKDYKQ